MLEKTGRWNDDARFSLNWLDQKRARIRRDGFAQRTDISERDDFESWGEGAKA